MPRRPYRAPREWLPREDYADFGVTDSVRTIRSAQRIPREEALRRSALRHHRVARAIRDAMRRAGMTLTDLALFADLHPNTVRDVLNGTSHANLATLTVLAEAVGLDVRIGVGPLDVSETPTVDHPAADRE